MCWTYDEEEKAFVILITQDGKEETYFVNSTRAFDIARNIYGKVLVCINGNRYQFVDGEPVLTTC